jgi:hypothetical protein
VPLSADVLVINGLGTAAVAADGDKNSAADGLRGICSLDLPPMTVGLLADSVE